MEQTAGHLADAGLGAQLDEGAPVALVGVAAPLGGELRPGHLIVANELRGTNGGGRRFLPMAALVAAELRRSGLGVHVGPLVSFAGSLAAAERASLASGGAVALDTASMSLMDGFERNPLAVVHSIVESTNGPSESAAPVPASLLGVRGPLERWARACGEHSVVLAAPRSFCAGVERAIETVKRALERYGAPVYVRRQIVHNLHVVRDLETRGAIFVEELDEVPPDSTVVFAAHGVSPAVRSQAAERNDLKVIDATCPLVTKVHTEARRYASQGHHLVLIGHDGHEEVEGTLGEAPDRFHLVERPEDVGRLDLGSEGAVAYLTQTTLATDETAEIVAALRERFPHITAPPADDICYATQNRQDAVRSIAHRCDFMLVVGSANSSNTARLVEVARREGCQAELVEDASQLQLGWLDGVATIGLTAGASAPDALVQELLETLRLLGPVSLSEETTAEETVRFGLPAQVR
ncbi:MAG: 4-hydroxy-3-methylbut-2-enyl diphosphate reductase [Acidimicrobiales bacterium]